MEDAPIGNIQSQEKIQRELEKLAAERAEFVEELKREVTEERRQEIKERLATIERIEHEIHFGEEDNNEN